VILNRFDVAIEDDERVKLLVLGAGTLRMLVPKAHTRRGSPACGGDLPDSVAESGSEGRRLCRILVGHEVTTNLRIFGVEVYDMIIIS